MKRSIKLEVFASSDSQNCAQEKFLKTLKKRKNSKTYQKTLDVLWSFQHIAN